MCFLILDCYLELCIAISCSVVGIEPGVFYLTRLIASSAPSPCETMYAARTVLVRPMASAQWTSAYFDDEFCSLMNRIISIGWSRAEALEICECKYSNPKLLTVCEFNGVPVREIIVSMLSCLTDSRSNSVSGFAEPATLDSSSQLKFLGNVEFHPSNHDLILLF